MAERPPQPDLTAILKDYRRRIEDMERQRLRLPASTDPLQTFESGSPLGDTRFLNFGQNIEAVLVGDDYVTISAAATAPEFDAIVDSTLTASVPASRLFKGIGEALAYLYSTVGLTTRAFVLVRKGTYTETADFIHASDVMLIGAASSMLSGGAPPVWNLNGFGGTNFGTLGLMNMTVQSGIKSGKSFFGSSGASTPYILFLSRVLLTSSAFTVGNAPLSQTGVVASESAFDTFDSGFVNTVGAFTHLSNCHIHARASAAIGMGTGASFLTVNNCIIGGGSGATITIPATTKFHASVDSSDWMGGGTSTFTLVGGGANGTYDIAIGGQAGLVTVTLSSADQATVRGNCASITVNAPAAGSTHLIEGRANNLDVSGPAMVDVMATGQVTIRGNGVNGHVGARRAGASGGTAIAFVSAVDCQIDAANAAVPGAGTTKSYSFDAASTGNLLVWQNHGAYPVAGTDAGTNNRVLPEGSVPFTTNGHVIQDEGVSLTQRLNLDFAGAGVTATDTAGRTLVTIPATATINGHVIEDEGTPLTQRANMNFVGGGVTVTDAGGKTLVTIPTGGTEPTAMDWMGY